MVFETFPRWHGHTRSSFKHNIGLLSPEYYMPYTVGVNYLHHALKTKSHHDANFVIIGDTTGYNENMWCHQEPVTTKQNFFVFSDKYHYSATLTHCSLVMPYDDTIWSTLVQVMACCLMATSHYLNQCWLIVYEVLVHFPLSNFTGNAQKKVWKWLIQD